METAVRVYRRYLKIEPTHTEEYIAYLKARGNWGEVARKLADLVNDETFRSLEGKSKHQMWLELADIITRHPQEVEDMKVDAILRGGIRKFTDEVRLAAHLRPTVEAVRGASRDAVRGSLSEPTNGACDACVG